MVFSVLNHVFLLKPGPPIVIEALIWCNIVQKYSEILYMVHLSQKSPENCHASYHACCSINLITGMGVCG